MQPASAPGHRPLTQIPGMAPTQGVQELALHGYAKYQNSGHPSARYAASAASGQARQRHPADTDNRDLKDNPWLSSAPALAVATQRPGAGGMHPAGNFRNASSRHTDQLMQTPVPTAPSHPVKPTPPALHPKVGMGPVGEQPQESSQLIKAQQIVQRLRQQADEAQTKLAAADEACKAAALQLMQAKVALQAQQRMPAVAEPQWCFLDGYQQNQGPYSIVQLQELLREYPNVIIHDIVSDVSLRFVDALNQSPGLLAAHIAVDSATAAHQGAQRLREPVLGQYREACHNLEAAEAALAVTRLSAELWVWQTSEGVREQCTPKELKERLVAGHIKGVTTVHCVQRDNEFRSAAEVVKDWEKALAHATARARSKPDASLLQRLPPFAEDHPCWSWDAEGASHGPFALAQIRAWVAEGRLPQSLFLSHSSQPGQPLLLKDVLLLADSRAVLGALGGAGEAAGVNLEMEALKQEAAAVQEAVKKAMLEAVTKQLRQLMRGSLSEALDAWLMRREDEARRQVAMEQHVTAAVQYDMARIMGAADEGAGAAEGDTSSLQPAPQELPSLLSDQHPTAPQLMSDAALIPEAHAAASTNGSLSAPLASVSSATTAALAAASIAVPSIPGLATQVSAQWEHSGPPAAELSAGTSGTTSTTTAQQAGPAVAVPPGIPGISSQAPAGQQPADAGGAWLGMDTGRAGFLAAEGLHRHTSLGSGSPAKPKPVRKQIVVKLKQAAGSTEHPANAAAGLPGQAAGAAGDAAQARSVALADADSWRETYGDTAVDVPTQQAPVLASTASVHTPGDTSEVSDTRQAPQQASRGSHELSDPSAATEAEARLVPDATEGALVKLEDFGPADVGVVGVAVAVAAAAGISSAAMTTEPEQAAAAVALATPPTITGSGLGQVAKTAQPEAAPSQLVSGPPAASVPKGTELSEPAVGEAQAPASHLEQGGTIGKRPAADTAATGKANRHCAHCSAVIRSAFNPLPDGSGFLCSGCIRKVSRRAAKASLPARPAKGAAPPPGSSMQPSAVPSSAMELDAQASQPFVQQPVAASETACPAQQAVPSESSSAPTEDLAALVSVADAASGPPQEVRPPDQHPEQLANQVPLAIPQEQGTHSEEANTPMVSATAPAHPTSTAPAVQQSQPSATEERHAAPSSSAVTLHAATPSEQLSDGIPVESAQARPQQQQQQPPVGATVPKPRQRKGIVIKLNQPGGTAKPATLPSHGSSESLHSHKTPVPSERQSPSASQLPCETPEFWGATDADQLPIKAEPALTSAQQCLALEEPQSTHAEQPSIKAEQPCSTDLMVGGPEQPPDSAATQLHTSPKPSDLSPLHTAEQLPDGDGVPKRSQASSLEPRLGTCSSAVAAATAGQGNSMLPEQLAGAVLEQIPAASTASATQASSSSFVSPQVAAHGASQPTHLPPSAEEIQLNQDLPTQQSTGAVLPASTAEQLLPQADLPAPSSNKQAKKPPSRGRQQSHPPVSHFSFQPSTAVHPAEAAMPRSSTPPLTSALYPTFALESLQFTGAALLPPPVCVLAPHGWQGARVAPATVDPNEFARAMVRMQQGNPGMHAQMMSLQKQYVLSVTQQQQQQQQVLADEQPEPVSVAERRRARKQRQRPVQEEDASADQAQPAAASQPRRSGKKRRAVLEEEASDAEAQPAADLQKRKSGKERRPGREGTTPEVDAEQLAPVPQHRSGREKLSRQAEETSNGEAPPPSVAQPTGKKRLLRQKKGMPSDDEKDGPCEQAREPAPATASSPAKAAAAPQQAAVRQANRVPVRNDQRVLAARRKQVNRLGGVAHLVLANEGEGSPLPGLPRHASPSPAPTEEERTPIQTGLPADEEQGKAMEQATAAMPQHLSAADRCSPAALPAVPAAEPDLQPSTRSGVAFGDDLVPPAAQGSLADQSALHRTDAAACPLPMLQSEPLHVPPTAATSSIESRPLHKAAAGARLEGLRPATSLLLHVSLPQMLSGPQAQPNTGTTPRLPAVNTTVSLSRPPPIVARSPTADPAAATSPAAHRTSAQARRKRRRPCDLPAAGTWGVCTDSEPDGDAPWEQLHHSRDHKQRRPCDLPAAGTWGVCTDSQLDDDATGEQAQHSRDDMGMDWLFENHDWPRMQRTPRQVTGQRAPAAAQPEHARRIRSAPKRWDSPEPAAGVQHAPHHTGNAWVDMAQSFGPATRRKQTQRTRPPPAAQRSGLWPLPPSSSPHPPAAAATVHPAGAAAAPPKVSRASRGETAVASSEEGAAAALLSLRAQAPAFPPRVQSQGTVPSRRASTLPGRKSGQPVGSARRPVALAAAVAPPSAQDAPKGTARSRQQPAGAPLLLQQHQLQPSSRRLPPNAAVVLGLAPQQPRQRPPAVKRRRPAPVVPQVPIDGCARALPISKLREFSAHTAVHALRRAAAVALAADVEPSGSRAIAAGGSRRGKAPARDIMTRGAEMFTDAAKWRHLTQRAKKLKFGRSKVHAWGLFAQQPIETGEFVVEYVGEVVRAILADKREAEYEASGLGSSYMFRIDEEWVVDATVRGGAARFINHSCDPNCYTQIINIGGAKKIGIYAKKPIQAGEELFYDYKFEFEPEDKKVPCTCGAKTCRKFLN